MTWDELCEFKIEGSRGYLAQVRRSAENAEHTIAEWEDAKKTPPKWHDRKDGSYLQAGHGNVTAGSLIRQSVLGGPDIWRAQAFVDEGPLVARNARVADREAAKRFIEKALGLPECETVTDDASK